MCEVKGKILVIEPTKTVGTKGFRVRSVVVETDEKYPQTVLIQFNQDDTEKLDNFKVGDYVEVRVNLRGREWTNPKGETKYFNSIVGWNIKKDEQSPQEPEYTELPDLNGEVSEDDMPF